MGILQFFTDIFESIFMSSSPEVKKKQALHKIEAELRAIQPVIYKGEMLQPNLAELFRMLYENCKPIDDLLAETISGDDVKRNGIYENQLLLTGFTGVNQEKLEKLGFDQRKQEVIDSNLPMNKVFENQKHTLEYLIKELNSPDFKKIDEIIGQLQQLTDICRYNYVNVIRKFDSEYAGFNPGYEPNFLSCTPDGMATLFQDLYFISAQFKVTSALGRAIIALMHLHSGDSVSDNDANRYIGYLKKINTIFTKYLTPQVLKNLIAIAKKDPDFEPQIASYKINARQKFANSMQEQFIADETRIKNDMKDRRIASDLNRLFGGAPLHEFNGYCEEVSNYIQTNSSHAFTWITPLQIAKSFLQNYFDEPVRALVNDIVIEGFFDNSASKSDFSGIVFAAVESEPLIDAFEASFGRGGKNDKALIDGYIADSHKNADFIKKLAETVDNVNEEAHQVVQTVTTSIYNLYVQMNDILIDSKKAKPDVIQNIKVLLGSTRNRDASSKLEQQFDQWATFLEIMKNYAIVGEVERK